jgi:hypothetical protein
MLRLAASRTWGAHPFFIPVEHTAYAREIVGPDAVLAVHQSVVLEPDRAKAREIARASIAARVAGQFAAGATHVCLGVATASPTPELASPSCGNCPRWTEKHMNASADLSVFCMWRPNRLCGLSGFHTVTRGTRCRALRCDPRRPL